MLPRNISWIAPEKEIEIPIFLRSFDIDTPVKNATFTVTCAGVYDAALNGVPVTDAALCPGWTSYEKRLQVQTWNITPLLSTRNALTVTVAEGWYRRPVKQWMGENYAAPELPAMLWGCITLGFEDGTTRVIPTDTEWRCAAGPVLEASIFDGEVYDARIAPEFGPVREVDYPTDTLIEQEGEFVREQEMVLPVCVISTPRGETVVDFGQNLTGYMAFTLTGKAGERLSMSCAEVLDKEGNFYTENYRAAKSRMTYICRDGLQSFKPRLTFFGFRYLRVDEAPEGFDPLCLRAIVLHSDMKRTGWLTSSDPLLNRLFSNIVWGQKGNFLDIPTDCPQRDERLGWTGDAQVFARAACYQFDTERFFTKWLHDMTADQAPDGGIPHVVPNALPNNVIPSAAWGDAAAVCPWEVYRAYGNKKILEEQYDTMRRWVDYIAGATGTPDLWTGGKHYGDWLGLDAPSGSCKGSTDPDLIASAFYARSIGIVVETGHILGVDVSEYERRFARARNAFISTYGDHLTTQTAKVLALYFDLTDDKERVAAELVQQIRDCGNALQTGFVGTPYLLYALSENGYAELAYTLLLKKDYPSWLYPVTKGATTVWEHWDGIRPDGGFWSKDMNSFNHYAYGAVADWVFSVACGICPAAPGYEKIRIAPVPDNRLESLSARFLSRQGEIVSGWCHTEGRTRYDITVPAPAEVVIEGVSHQVEKGSYVFWGK